MSKIEEYNSMLNRISEYNEEIASLESNPIVKEYLDVVNARNKDLDMLKELKYIVTKEKMDNCNHMFVCVYKTNDEDSIFCNTYACVKCGYNPLVNEKHKTELTDDEIIISRCVNEINMRNLKGVYIDRLCDFEEAKEIYERVLSENPNITDTELAKLMDQEIENLKFKKIKKPKIIINTSAKKRG